MLVIAYFFYCNISNHSKVEGAIPSTNNPKYGWIGSNTCFTHSIIFFLGDEKMTFNNTTLAIVGIIIIGILSTYMGNNELAAVALGGIVGWISRSYSNSGGIVNDPRC